MRAPVRLDEEIAMTPTPSRPAGASAASCCGSTAPTPVAGFGVGSPQHAERVRAQRHDVGRVGVLRRPDAEPRDRSLLLGARLELRLPDA
jgi:hypothetical protein